MLGAEGTNYSVYRFSTSSEDDCFKEWLPSFVPDRTIPAQFQTPAPNRKSYKVSSLVIGVFLRPRLIIIFIIVLVLVFIHIFVITIIIANLKTIVILKVFEWLDFRREAGLL
jgi:hypothetical protein